MGISDAILFLAMCSHDIEPTLHDGLIKGGGSSIRCCKMLDPCLSGTRLLPSVRSSPLSSAKYNAHYPQGRRTISAQQLVGPLVRRQSLSHKAHFDARCRDPSVVLARLWLRALSFLRLISWCCRRCSNDLHHNRKLAPSTLEAPLDRVRAGVPKGQIHLRTGVDLETISRHEHDKETFPAG
ncbi:uncharacterized protein CC84DRAFT_910815 [Paraphaeosphaeria sporulosa]|uniref:Uncharacterized protein n=1 Tax=Paraphaeosphaeria sporulosa TaxID=1460663 RepID=A0A177C7H0_9PLEO|nr:uncharacterized protein CC84DRAFT_910815 [Paraphaeosphaeria sporulosa]OAG02718.1 hypothetical protein CC84DRAFT_910815 [Paraphaeosphaeria sporulosa]